jgi:hypothetical protein
LALSIPARGHVAARLRLASEIRPYGSMGWLESTAAVGD